MAAVMSGQRPNLDEIQGPENIVVFMKSWVEKCWDGEPEQRPTFGGESFASVLSVCVRFHSC